MGGGGAELLRALSGARRALLPHRRGDQGGIGVGRCEQGRQPRLPCSQNPEHRPLSGLLPDQEGPCARRSRCLGRGAWRAGRQGVPADRAQLAVVNDQQLGFVPPGGEGVSAVALGHGLGDSIEREGREGCRPARREGLL